LFAGHYGFKVAEVAGRVDGLDQRAVSFVAAALSLVLDDRGNLCAAFRALRQLPNVGVSLLSDGRLRKELLGGFALGGVHAAAGHFEFP
jgi:hypothetical protein